MKIEAKICHAILMGVFFSVAGCSQQAPATGTVEPQSPVRLQANEDGLFPPPELRNQRTLKGDGDRLDVASFDAMLAQIPDRIPIADAERLLVHVDPSKIVSGNNYSVLARGGGGHGGHGGGHGGHGGRGGGYGHGGHGYGGYGHGYFNRGNWGYGAYGGWGYPYGAFGYYPYSNYYFPYYAYGSYYYPYVYDSALPFLYGYGYNSLYSPYAYTGYSYLPWANYGVQAPSPQQLSVTVNPPATQSTTQPVTQSVTQPPTQVAPQSVPQTTTQSVTQPPTTTLPPTR